MYNTITVVSDCSAIARQDTFFEILLFYSRLSSKIKTAGLQLRPHPENQIIRLQGLLVIVPYSIQHTIQVMSMLKIWWGTCNYVYSLQFPVWGLYIKSEYQLCISGLAMRDSKYGTSSLAGLDFIHTYTCCMQDSTKPLTATS